jgi:hypothetical protein
MVCASVKREQILNLYDLKRVLVYLTTLFQLRRVDDRIILNDELKMTWKEELLSYFTVWFIYPNIPALAWRNWERPQESSIRTAGLRIDNSNQGRPEFMYQEC